MRRFWCVLTALVASFVGVGEGLGDDRPTVPLPNGVRAVWDAARAYRETTPTRERISVNGLWRWQPAADNADKVPTGEWGYFKVPGCWPGITDYMQKDCQTVYAHPRWKDRKLGGISAAWYEREIAIPEAWAGRRIALTAEYLNSFAAIYIDGRRVGEIRFPAGEVELTSVCHPGATHVLSMLVVAMPLKAVMLAHSDSNSARQVKGSVARRGLCGDVWLVSTPAGPRISDVKIDTSVRKGEISCDVAFAGLAGGAEYALEARIRDGSREVAKFTSIKFKAGGLKDGRVTLT
jgi:beta-galactosidase